MSCSSVYVIHRCLSTIRQSIYGDMEEGHVRYIVARKRAPGLPSLASLEDGEIWCIQRRQLALDPGTSTYNCADFSF
jgi:hypothetical protein